MKYWIFASVRGLPFPVLIHGVSNETQAHYESNYIYSTSGCDMVNSTAIGGEIVASFVVYCSAVNLPYPFFALHNKKALVYIRDYQSFIENEDCFVGDDKIDTVFEKQLKHE